MRHQKRATDKESNLLCCVRHGYTEITPNACIEKWTPRPDLCGSCRNHHKAAERLSLVVPGGLIAVHQLAREKRLGTIADPYIQTDDLEHEGRPQEKKVSMFIVWINGLRAPSNDVTVKSRASNAAHVDASFSQAILGERTKLKHLCVEQKTSGRTNAIFEWSRPADFKDPELGSQVSVRLTAIDIE